MDRKPAKFTLGVKLDIGDDGRVKILEVLPGGAAERAGLRAGDMLAKIAGKELGNDPLAVLSPALETGGAIDIEVERDGHLKTVTVKPDPR
jgi:C-terminal processing protease CtpA/Prc